MENKPVKSLTLGEIHIGPDKLKTFFVIHLNRIYCAKQHLLKRMPDVAREASFKDLQKAISEMKNNVERQIARMEEVFTILDADITFEGSKGLIGLMEDAFTAIRQGDTDAELRDLAILFYMQNIESVEMASFQVLQLAAIKMRNEPVKKLLRENYDEAQGDRALLMTITAKYVAS